MSLLPVLIPIEIGDGAMELMHFGHRGTCYRLWGRSRWCFLLVLAWLVLAVWPLHAQDVPIPDSVLGQQYFALAFVDNPTPFVGQQISYRFRFYYLSPPSSPLEYHPPDFEGFWRGEVGPDTGNSQLLNGQQYGITERAIVLYPSRAGTLEIPPSELILRPTVFDEGTVLTTEPVVLQVQPLPDGAPVDFAGAVGQFEIRATLDRQSAQQGEPLTLRLTMRGTGNIEQLLPPNFPVPSDWRVYANPAVYNAAWQDGVVVGEKTFEWLLIPDGVGLQELPAITLSYFDPVSGVYRTISTAPVTLEILPAEDLPPTSSPHVTAPSSSSHLSLKPIPATLRSASLYPGPVFWLLWVVPPGCASAGWWWMTQQERRQRDRVRIRQSTALLRAREHLQAAQRAKPENAHRLVSQAVLAYFGDKLNCPPRGLSQADLHRALAEREIAEALVAQLLECLEWLDQARYAPGNATDVRSLANRMLQVLAAVDAAWK